MPAQLRKVVTAAAILKAIRDGRATDVEALANLFEDRSPGWTGTTTARTAPRSVLLNAIERHIADLEAVGAIEIDRTAGINFKVAWYDRPVLPLRNTSLTALDDIAQAGSLVVHPAFGEFDRAERGADLFVLMSFEERFAPTYEVIKQAGASASLIVRRADDLFTTHAIMLDIWTQIQTARAIIADCTGRNANVFYEIGIAHTIGKSVILLTQTEEDVPFDLRAIRYIKYSLTGSGPQKLERQLLSTIRELIGSPPLQTSTSNASS